VDFRQYLGGDVGNNIPPVGPFPGDRRMDQVENQRTLVYGVNAAPGYVCFEDGSCITQEEYDRSYGQEREYPQPGPPPQAALDRSTTYAPQFAPGPPPNPENGRDFAAMVHARQMGDRREVSGNGVYGVRARPGEASLPTGGRAGQGAALLALLEAMRRRRGPDRRTGVG
jgi:hypothetical protein